MGIYGANLLTWLERVIEAKSTSEAPERYFYWSSLAAISAVVGKNVFLDRFHYKLYCNIYVIIVSAKSGLRKGIPVSFAKSIVTHANTTRVIAGQNSIQGIVQELSKQKTLESGRTLTGATAFLCAPEFDSFLIDDPKALTYLTDMYNTHEHESGWDKMLKSGTESLKDLCLTLLAASNEVLFEDLVRGKDIEGGFIARSIIVYESKRARKNPLTRMPIGLVSNEDLSIRLKEISQVKGTMLWSQAAIELYEVWYDKICELQFQDKTGTLERLGDTVLKVAMLINLSKTNELVLSGESLQEAIERCEECVSGLTHVSLGSKNGASPVSGAIAKILKVLLTVPDHEISRQKLLRKVWPEVDCIVLDQVIENLIQSGAIENPVRRGKDIIYKMKQEIYEAYKDFKKEVN